MKGYTDPFFTGITVLHFSIGTKALCLPKEDISLFLSQLVHQKT